MNALRDCDCHHTIHNGGKCDCPPENAAATTLSGRVAFAQGQLAHENGRTIEANPYISWPDYEAWRAGWEAARVTDPQDMEAADEIIFQWSARTPSGRREWLAGVIAQARVDAEREAEFACAECGTVMVRKAGAFLERIDALAAQVEALRLALMGCEFLLRNLAADLSPGQIPQSLDDAQRALAAIPAASLIAHDNALIERCAVFAEVEYDAGCHEASCHHPDRPCDCYLHEIAVALRALKTDSEGSTM